MNHPFAKKMLSLGTIAILTLGAIALSLIHDHTGKLGETGSISLYVVTGTFMVGWLMYYFHAVSDYERVRVGYRTIKAIPPNKRGRVFPQDAEFDASDILILGTNDGRVLLRMKVMLGGHQAIYFLLLVDGPDPEIVAIRTLCDGRRHRLVMSMFSAQAPMALMIPRTEAG